MLIFRLATLVFSSAFTTATLFLYPGGGFDHQWTNPLESGDWGACYGVAADEHGNVYSTGFTVGKLGGVKAKAKDAFLLKHDATGKLVWAKLFGSRAIDSGNGVAVNPAGTIGITGTTSGKMGETFEGSFDAFVAMSDAAGKQLWVRQMGTKSYDEGQDIAFDKDGNVLVTGWTQGDIEGVNSGKEDVFVVKLDSLGKVLWKRQFGTKASERGNGIASDHQGNVFVAGITRGDLAKESAGADDAFLAKFSPQGKQLWIKQIGTPGIDYCFGVEVDSAGEVFIAGHTQGALGGPSQGALDIFVARFDPEGKRKWTKQLGTKEADACFDFAIGGDGKLFVSGGTTGDFDGPNRGSRDAILAMLSPDGDLLSKFQLGSSEYDNAMALSVGRNGNVFIGGETSGQFDGPDVLEDSDAFIAKFKVKMNEPAEGKKTEESPQAIAK